ncbi:MAG TPA: alpha/beta hydrolase [Verrucomicrobiae bacterium]|nr:alpha/beta hydrolase [Verrucomicrobiae bacterium]
MKSTFPARIGILLLLASLSVALLAEEPGPIPLWPNGAPGSEGKTTPEAVRVTEGGDHVVTGVHNPSITPYLPVAGQATGAAVLVIPGGGHRELWMDHEGYAVAKWLRDHGVAAFVLKYRLARETNSTYQIETHALADTQRALRLIRSRASEWGVNPARLGVMGFSAGGELAALAGMRFDAGRADATDPVERAGCKPGFQALIYPGNSKGIIPAKDSPPAFLACAFNDRPDISEGLATVYLRFKQAGVATELHIYSSGGHGFGVRAKNSRPVATWLARFDEWLADSGFLKQP